MEFEQSLEAADLIASLEGKKPRSEFAVGQPKRYELVLKFRNPSDLETAQQNLVALLPESEAANIVQERGVGIETGDVSHKLLVPRRLLSLLKRAEKQAAAPEVSGPVNHVGFVASLDARSRLSGSEPRQGSDDPLHPEKSVNTFMNELRGSLEHTFDLCERLEHARTKAGGQKHKYYASTGNYGLRFDALQDADNAKRIFSALIGVDTPMVVDSEVINHKAYYWLKVPSEAAGQVLDKAKEFSAKYARVKDMFTEDNVADATAARDALLTEIESLGLSGTHVADQMTREFLRGATKERVR